MGKDNPSLQAAAVVTSQSYLVTDADNYTIKDLHISDRVGLKLHLDRSQNYSLSLTDQATLSPLNLFHYYSVSDSYYAVYQAKSKGKIQLDIIYNKCITGITCTNSVYTLTINVQ